MSTLYFGAAFGAEVKKHKHTLRQIRAMAFENGLVWGAAIVAMAEAIRDRYDLCECWRSCECYHPEVIAMRAMARDDRGVER